MTRQARVVLMCLGTWFSLALLVVAGVILVPPLVQERVATQQSQDEIQQRRGDLEIAAKRIAELESKRRAFEEKLAKYRRELDQATFTPALESRMPDFLDRLETSCSQDGVRLVDLVYKERRIEAPFVTLPFEARVEGEYGALRRLLASFETWPEPMRLEELEMVSPVDLRGVMQWRFSGTARFVLGG